MCVCVRSLLTLNVSLCITYDWYCDLSHEISGNVSVFVNDKKNNCHVSYQNSHTFLCIRGIRAH